MFPEVKKTSGRVLKVPQASRPRCAGSRGNLTQANHALAIETKVLAQSRPPPCPPHHPRRRRRRASASPVATSAAGSGGGGGELMREVEIIKGHLLACHERPRRAQQQAIVERGVAVGWARRGPKV